MLIVPATGEAEVGGSGPAWASNETLSSDKNKDLKYSSVVECSPSVLKALSSIPSRTKKKKKKVGGEIHFNTFWLSSESITDLTILLCVYN